MVKRKQGAEEEIVGVGEAAKIQGVTEGRIRQLLVEGEIPSQKIGRTWVMRRADVESFQRRPRGGFRPRKGVE